MMGVEDEHPEFSAATADPAFYGRVRVRSSNRSCDDLDACTGEDRVDEVVELCVPVADQELETRRAVVEVYEQVAGLL